MKVKLRSQAVIRREITFVQKQMNRSNSPDSLHFYGARQALEWVLRDNAMAASRAFRSKQQSSAR